MAVIGTFKRQGDDFAGDIQTLALKVQRVTITREQKRSDNAPEYRIYAGGAEIGAAWEKSAQDSGAVYLSVKIDDPSLPSAINAALVQDSQGDQWSLLWSRTPGGK
jgi:uncharacterized protein (DUF736 family)